MQPRTAAPREHLTDAQVDALLTGPRLEVKAGLELLDDHNRLVEDISDDLAGGVVRHDGLATVHGRCDLRLMRRLTWGRDRVRPYMTLSDGAIEARFNLGVYVMTAPIDRRGETPQTWDVAGFDLLQLLATEGPGDTYVVDPDPSPNLIANPDFAVNTAGWESNPAFGAYTPATLSRVVDGDDTLLEVTWPTAAKSWVNTTPILTGLVPGKVYRFRADLEVPPGGPDDFSFDLLFITSSPWVTPAKGTRVTIDYLWTATATEAFFGIATRNTTAGQKTRLTNVRFEALSTTYLDAVRSVLEAAGSNAPVLLDGTGHVTVPPGPMVWALTDADPVTWLRIINDLLAAINYRGLWVDENGSYRSAPYLPPERRPIDRVFDAESAATIVHRERSYEQNVTDIPNWWRFVRRGINYRPTEGDGMYTVTNQSAGPSSKDAIGRWRKRTVFLDAADQIALEAQGDRIVATDTASSRKITLRVDPMPLAGHLDVVRVIDGPDLSLAQVISWELPLDGAPGTWVAEVIQ